MSTSRVNLPVSKAMVSIYVSPSEVFAQLKQSRNWGWLAFLMLFGIYLLSNILFFNAMDTEWLVNSQMESLGDLSEVERAEAERVLKNVSEYMGISSGIGAIVVTLLLSLILTGSYMLLANTGQEKYSFNDWFVLVLWTQLPFVSKYLLFLVLFFLTPTSELELDLMNYSSLNQLVFSYGKDEALHFWLEFMDLFYLWQIALAAIGIRVWCGVHYVKAISIAAAPYLLFFGIWLIVI